MCGRQSGLAGAVLTARLAGALLRGRKRYFAGVVTLAVAFYLRSAVAPLVTLATVAISYLLSVRLVAVASRGTPEALP